ncbi:MAG: hypothetical protein F6K18_03255 [Okeania sp. SIO2C2]|uniref:hypothetical protein n=1 Tax=Okeania sp. SIO2C2 TaxID=2607787 RepID=UPI0013BAF842|nr:hypothetical protein [Okeania sp. SIO2C2]NEP85913.1 hypothetical protein [Okeania sp. SIO2C2]
MTECKSSNGHDRFLTGGDRPTEDKQTRKMRTHPTAFCRDVFQIKSRKRCTVRSSQAISLRLAWRWHPKT